MLLAQSIGDPNGDSQQANGSEGEAKEEVQ